MYDLKSQLGIKSYSFRSISDNADVAKAVKYCEADVIDLSACHVNYDSAEEQERAIATYRDAGVRIAGIGVVYLKNDESFNRRFFEFARRAGCGVVSCSLPLEGLESAIRLTERLAEEYDVRAAIHNHGGKDWLGNTGALQYVLGKTSERIGLCLDTAWCLQAGEDPIKWLDTFQGRIHALHFKDFSFNAKGQWQDTIVGEGALDLGTFLGKFATIGFDGPAVVEFEGENPVEQSKACVKAIRAAL